MGLVDIKISVISARGLGNPHRFRRKPSFTVELTLENETKYTDARQSEDRITIWHSDFVFRASLESTLKVRIYCKHRHHAKDHVVGEASLEVLRADRNKDIEIGIGLPDRSINHETSLPTFLKLHLKVVFPSMSSIKHDVDTNSANLHKQMERMIETLSAHKIKQLAPAWIRLFSSLNKFTFLARSAVELDSKAKVAFGAVAFAIKILVDQVKRDEKIENIGRIMNELYTYVIDACSCSVRKIVSFQNTLQLLLTQTAECAYFIIDYQRISTFSQRAVIHLASNADTMISNFETAFGEIKISLILGSSLQTALVSYKILQTVERIENLIRIDRLPILEDVGWDSEKTCLRGTRENTINHIIRWASGNIPDTASSSRVCILSGPISSGKSTIAHTIAKMFHEQNRLGAAIFLHGGVFDASSKRISSSIVHQLAGYDASLHSQIAAKIKADQSLTWADARRQFRALVVETTYEADCEVLMIGPVLIVIDGLDKIDDEEQRKFLSTIAEHSQSLPANFRILLTSRDANTLVQNVRRELTCCFHTIGFDETDGNSNISIGQQVSRLLLDLFSKNPKVATTYEFNGLRDQMERRARGIFFWVATLARSLMACESEDDYACFLFSLLLSNTLPLSDGEAMDQLYRALFTVFFPDKASAQHLFVTMIQSHHFMTMPELNRLACIPPTYLDEATNAEIAQRLGLIVQINQDDEEPLFGVHLSLEDFLTNPHWCQGTGIYVNLETPMYQSTSAVCVHIMNRSLRYNICNIEDSMVMEEIADKSSRAEQYISKPLQYACCNWTSCFDEGDDSDLDNTLHSKLQIFISTHILHWIEVMIYLGHLNDIGPVLLRFLRWMQKRNISSSDVLHVLTADTIEFARAFSAIISKAPLQIYISALPLMPSDTLLSRQFGRDTVLGRSYSNPDIKHKWVMQGILFHYPTCFCSDSQGALIALGRRTGGSIFLMDAKTGAKVRPSLYNIRTDKDIQSMAFTPDGKHLAIVTVNGEIVIYDVSTGSCIHSSRIDIAETSISYSSNNAKMLIVSRHRKPNGTRLIELRVCSTRGISPLASLSLSIFIIPTDGASLLLEAMSTCSPSRVVLSPDGQMLAIPNKVGVQLYSLDTGPIVDRGIVAKHTHLLSLEQLEKCLVIWSPDTTFIAVALVGEGTIRLWSCQDEKTTWTIYIDETSHSAYSYALDISVDSSRIAFAWSYSDDRGHSIFRMQIWDTKTARNIGNEAINEGTIRCLQRSISISPDGSKIVSWSNAHKTDGSPWKSLLYFFSDTSPAYMSDCSKTSQPICHEPDDVHIIPTVSITFSFYRPNTAHSFILDAEGWIIDFSGTRIILVPYPNFDIITTLHLRTSVHLSIRHPGTKKIVLKYILKWCEVPTAWPVYRSLQV